MSEFKVLVATDGSEAVLRACRELVEEMSLGKDAEIRILTVLSFTYYPYPLADYADPSDTSERLGEVDRVVGEATRETEAIFLKAGHEPVVIHRFGNPGDEITAEVAEWGPHLVVLGRRGLGPFGRLMGSVSERVLHHSKVPVLVAP